MKIFICIISALFFLAGCSKYEEGPGFSFYTRKYRICNNWQLSKIENRTTGIALDTTLSKMVWAFEENGDFWKSDDTKGIWEFSGDVNLLLTFDSDGDELYEETDSTSTYIITRLSNKELWLVLPEPNDDFEYKYSPVGK